MKSIILIAALGSVVPLVSCKPIAREPESQPEALAASVPKYVQNFLEAAKGNPSDIGILYRVRELYDFRIFNWAAEHGDDTMFKNVIKMIKKFNIIDDHEINSSLYFAAKSADANKRISYLIEQGGDLNKALIIGGEYGDLDAIRLLVKRGGDPNGSVDSAIEVGKVDIVPSLVEELGADVNKGLVTASRYGHVDMAKYMVDKGATNLNAALLKVVEQYVFNFGGDRGKMSKMIKYLLEQGATNADEVLVEVKPREWIEGERLKEVQDVLRWHQIKLRDDP